jgi:RimJ/RimL family protein N-acetyltransferase
MARAPSPDVALRPFGRADFDRLIAWVGTQETLSDWCAAYFSHPLDHAQLARYLEAGERPNGPVIVTAATPSGEVVGHVELSHVWPHLSSRLSRVLVAPERRRRGIGRAMVARALGFSFDRHHVDRIDLGVAAGNAAAIACYAGLGFRHVGTWPRAMQAGARVIDVTWMTLTRDAWAAGGTPA